MVVFKVVFLIHVRISIHFYDVYYLQRQAASRFSCFLLSSKPLKHLAPAIGRHKSILWGLKIPPRCLAHPL